MHTYKTRTTWSRRTTAASVRDAWGGWGRGERGTGDRTGSFRMRKTGKRLMFRTLHLATFSSRSIQFLVILCGPSRKEGSELMYREFAAKVSRKDRRKSYLAIAWELKIAAIIDTRGAREEPLLDGLWNVQPESLRPDWAVLCNMIREGEEIRVGKERSSFVLIVKRIGVTYSPFECLCAAWTIPARNGRKSASSARDGGAGSVNLRIHVTRFLLDRVCVSARRGMV